VLKSCNFTFQIFFWQPDLTKRERGCQGYQGRVWRFNVFAFCFFLVMFILNIYTLAKEMWSREFENGGEKTYLLCGFQKILNFKAARTRCGLCHAQCRDTDNAHTQLRHGWIHKWGRWRTFRLRWIQILASAICNREGEERKEELQITVSHIFIMLIIIIIMIIISFLLLIISCHWASLSLLLLCLFFGHF